MDEQKQKENKWKVKHLTRTQIWKIPERDDVIRMIKEGQSSEKIRRYMSECGHKIGYHALRSFRETLETGANEYGLVRLREIDRIIDPVSKHAMVVSIMAERVQEMRELEKKGELSRLDKHELRRCLETLAIFSEQHVRVKQALGMIPLPLQRSASLSQQSFNSEYGKLMKGKLKIKTKKAV